MQKFGIVFAACALMTAGAHAAESATKDSSSPELARDWVAMDVDRDGHITPDEMVNYEKKKAEQKK